MKACYKCGKSKNVGMQVSHSHKRMLRDWKPNLQKTKVTVGKQQKTVLMCAKCIKTNKHLALS